MIMALLFFTACSPKTMGVIHGQVLEENTGKPVENATVVLQQYECLNGMFMKTVTNDDGRFSLDISQFLKMCNKKKVEFYLTKEDFRSQKCTYDTEIKNQNVVIKLQQETEK